MLAISARSDWLIQVMKWRHDRWRHLAQVLTNPTYFLRSLPDISNELKRLDQAIDEQLLKPLLDNYAFNYSERKWYSLPTRRGGLGIIIPSEVSDMFYRNSRCMTNDLVYKIVNQNRAERVKSDTTPDQTLSEIRAGKRQKEEETLTYVKGTLDPQKLKILEAISEKGASNWLTTMPIREHGFHLSKQEFWDSIRTRYGIPLTRLPSKCVACGVPFNVEHAFSCKFGGYVTIRHNEIRDFTAEVLREVCQNVEVEPLLTPLTGHRCFIVSTLGQEFFSLYGGLTSKRQKHLSLFACHFSPFYPICKL